MKQPPPKKTRSLALVLAAAFVLTFAVGGLGLFLTGSQYYAVRDLLLESKRQRAEEVREDLLDRLEGRYAEALDAVEGELRTGRTSDAAREFDFVDEAFAMSARGEVYLPSHPRPDPFVRERAAAEVPAAVRATLAPLWSSGRRAAASAGAHLEAALTRPDLPALWRPRVEALLAAAELAEGDPAAARARYDRLIAAAARRSEGEAVDGTPGPSYLQLVLAAAPAFASAPDELRAHFTAAFARLARGEFVVSRDEEAQFVHTARAVFESIEPPAELAALERRLARESEVLRLGAVLQRGVRARAALQLAAAEERPPPAVAALPEEMGGAAVWRFVEERAGGDPVVVGFVASAASVARLAAREIAATGETFTVNVAPSPEHAPGSSPSDFVALAELRGGHDAVAIGIPANEWQRLVGRARTPFLIAGALVVLLALGLCACLFAGARAVRRELQLSAMKTEFVANVSHELKTPLALIRMFAETLLLGRVENDAKRDEYYRIITRESERLTHLISNVLSFSSIDAGKKRYEFAPTDLGDVVRDVAASYRHQLENQGFTHELRVAPDLPIVDADADAIRQAVINLIENAIRYSADARHVTIELELGDGGESVDVVVRDRGIGIAADDQSKIWDDYFRTKGARALATRGSGLGLSVVRHIVEAHGGSVRLESQPGAGSTFTLSFPARGDTAPEVRRRRSHDAAQDLPAAHAAGTTGTSNAASSTTPPPPA